MKTCSRCKRSLATSDFHRSSERRDGLHPVCKTCKRAEDRKRLYGLTPEEEVAMLDAQHGVCAICETPNPGGRGMWHVDHCHDTDRVRGLLCFYCNTRVMAVVDDEALLAKALTYKYTNTTA
jgi:hypothetical protein